MSRIQESAARSCQKLVPPPVAASAAAAPLRGRKCRPPPRRSVPVVPELGACRGLIPRLLRRRRATLFTGGAAPGPPPRPPRPRQPRLRCVLGPLTSRLQRRKLFPPHCRPQIVGPGPPRRSGGVRAAQRSPPPTAKEDFSKGAAHGGSRRHVRGRRGTMGGVKRVAVRRGRASFDT